MANHAWIYTDTLPTHEVIDKDIRHLVARKFSMLKVKSVENGWIIYHPEDEDYLALAIWHSYFQEYNTTGKTGERIKAIEFRHGHPYRILYWIESYIRASLAKKYNCKAWDDGIGPYQEKDPAETLEEYWPGWLNWVSSKAELKTLPKDLRNLVEGK